MNTMAQNVTYKYTGLTTEQALQKLKKETILSLQSSYRNYSKNLSNYIEESKKNVSVDILGMAAYFPSTQYNLVKGFLEGAGNLLQGVNILFATAVNDLSHIFDSSDKTGAFEDLIYTFGNFFLSATEAATISTIGGFAQLDALFGGKSIESFQEKAKGIKRNTDLYRAFLLNPVGIITTEIANELQKQIDTIKNNALDQVYQSENTTDTFDTQQYGENNEVITNIADKWDELSAKYGDIGDSRYYQATKDYINGSIEAQKWINENVFSKAASSVTTFGLGELSDSYLKNDKFYEWYSGTAQSVGNILFTWTLGKFGAGLGMSASQVSAMTSTAFAANVFGKSYSDAIQKGADFKDAYTYGIGQALTETVLENLGGFTPGGQQVSDFTEGLLSKVIGGKAAQIFLDSFSEGMEELGAEFLQSGLSTYVGEEPDKGNVFIEKAAFSFLSGAVSSMALSGMTPLYANLGNPTTVETKTLEVAKSFNTDVTKLGGANAVINLKTKINSLVEYLNSKNARVMKTDENGEQVVRKMNEEDKIAFIEESGMSNFVFYNEQTKRFETKEFVKNINTDSFKNTIKKEVTNAEGKTELVDVVVDEGEYAISDTVLGVDLTANNTIVPTKFSDLTEFGKILYEVVKNSNSRIVIFNDVNRGPAHYNTEDNVIYINENHLKYDKYNIETMKTYVIKHEMVHSIYKNNPELYNELLSLVGELIEIKTDTGIQADFKNKDLGYTFDRIFKRLSGAEISMQDMVDSYFKDYYERVKRSNEKNNNILTEEEMIEKTLDMVKQEIVAFFIENLIDGNEVSNVLFKNKIGITQKIKDALNKKVFGKDVLKDIARGNKKILKQLENIRSVYSEAAQEVLVKEKALSYFLESIIKTNNIEEFIKKEFNKQFDKQTNEFYKEFVDKFKNKELIEKYGAKRLIEIIFENIDETTGEVKIDNVVYNISDLLDIDESDLVMERKFFQNSNASEIVGELKMDSDSKKYYKKLLNRMETYKTNLQAQSRETLLLTDPQAFEKLRKETKEEVEFINDILDNLLDNTELNAEQKEYLSQLVLADKGRPIGENIDEIKPEKPEKITGVVTAEERLAVRNLVQKVVRLFSKTGFKDFKNSADSMRSAYYYFKINDTNNAETEVKSVEKVVAILMSAINKDNRYIVTSKLTNNIGEIFVTPTQDLINKEIEKQTKKLEEVTIEIKEEVETDSEGFELTFEQKKFNKGNVVRDSEGKLLVLYHGSENYGFREFKKDKRFNGHFYFTNSKTIAKTYIDTLNKRNLQLDFKTVEEIEIFVKEKIKNYFLVKREDIVKYSEGSRDFKEDDDYNLLLNYFMLSFSKGSLSYNQTEVNKFLEANRYRDFFLVEKTSSFGNTAYYPRILPFSGISDFNQNILETFPYLVEEESDIGLYRVYVNLKNPLIVYGNGAGWSNITNPFINMFNEKKLEEFESFLSNSVNFNFYSGIKERYIKTRDIEFFVTEIPELRAKYDGIIIKDIVDSGGNNELIDVSEDAYEVSDIVVAFNSNQIKSTENKNPTNSKDIFENRDYSKEIILDIFNFKFNDVIFNSIKRNFTLSAEIQGFFENTRNEKDFLNFLEDKSKKYFGFGEDDFKITFEKKYDVLNGAYGQSQRDEPNFENLFLNVNIFKKKDEGFDIFFSSKIIIPNFSNDEVQIINNVFKYDLDDSLDFVTILVKMPLHNSFNLQKEINQDLKLINQSKNNLSSFYLGNKRQPIKTAVQTWVRKTNEIFKNVNDLRQTKSRPINHEDYISFVLNGESSKYENGRKFDFDFAIQTQGNGVDFNKIYTDFADLNPSGKYILIKAKNSDILKKLKSIDFLQLAKEGSNMREGFNSADLVEKYSEISNKEINQKEPVEKVEYSLLKYEAIKRFTELYEETETNLQKIIDGISFKDVPENPNESSDSYKRYEEIVNRIDDLFSESGLSDEIGYMSESSYNKIIEFLDLIDEDVLLESKEISDRFDKQVEKITDSDSSKGDISYAFTELDNIYDEIENKVEIGVNSEEYFKDKFHDFSEEISKMQVKTKITFTSENKTKNIKKINADFIREAAKENWAFNDKNTKIIKVDGVGEIRIFVNSSYDYLAYINGNRIYLEGNTITSSSSNKDTFSESKLAKILNTVINNYAEYIDLFGMEETPTVMERKSPDQIKSTVPVYEKTTSNNTIRLYHNTQSKNIDSILKNGLSVNNASQIEFSGKTIWAVSLFNQKGYGGNTIAFELPYSKKENGRFYDDKDEVFAEEVGKDTYNIYSDIKPENLLFVDRYITEEVRYSELPYLIRSYGFEHIYKYLNEFSILKENELESILQSVREYLNLDSGLKDIVMERKSLEEINKGINLEDFKGSKVVDSNGILLKVYHGTNADFDVFDFNLAGSNTESDDASMGVFFSDNKYVLEVYGKNDKVYYLNIKKPIDFRSFPSDEFIRDYAEAIQKTTPQEEEYIREYYSQYSEDGIFFEMVKSFVDDDYMKERLFSVKSDLGQNKKLLNYLRSKFGYDGFIGRYGTADFGGAMFQKTVLKAFEEQFGEENGAKKMIEVGGSSEYAVFSPSQIYTVSNGEEDMIMERKSPQQLLPVNQETNDIIRKMLNPFISNFFVQDANGNLILKNQNIVNTKVSENKVTIYDAATNSNIVYSGSEYAVVTYGDMSNKTIFQNQKRGFLKPLKISEMSKEEKVYFDFFSSTNLSFILYHGNQTTLGFSYNINNINVVFINTNFLFISPEDTSETLWHETIHEIFKFAQKDALLLASKLADLMFIKDASGNYVPSPVFDLFIKTRGYKTHQDFVKYLHDGYNFKIKTVGEIYTLLKNQTNLDYVNEITAQISGNIFSNFESYKNVFNGKSQLTVAMYNIYEKIMTNSTVSQNVKDYFKETTKVFADVFGNYMKEIAKLFPVASQFSVSSLNDFVKIFTDGEFTTKIDLLRSYFNERKNHTRGSATVALDNIFYIASYFDKTVTTASENFKKIIEDFEKFKQKIEFILNPKVNEDLFQITGTKRVFKDYKEIISTIKGIVDKLNDFSKLVVSDPNYNSDMIDIAISISQIEQLIDDFGVYYSQIDDYVLELFGLPLSGDMDKLLGKIILELDIYVKEITKNNNLKLPEIVTSFSELTSFLEIFKSEKEVLKNSGLQNLVKVVTDARIEKIKNIKNALKTRIINAVEAIKGAPYQKKSPLSNEVKFIINRLEKIVSIIEDNKFSFDDMKKEILPILDEMRGFNNLPNGQEVEIDLNGEKIMIKNNLYLKTQADNEVKFEKIFSLLSGLFFDKNIIASRFNKSGFNSYPIEKLSILFNEVSLSTALISILKSFETVYTSSFSDDTLTHDQTAVQVVTQITQNLDSKNPLKTGANKFFNIMTPQDFFRTFKELLSGKVDFFEKFYNNYIEAIKRQENILMEMDITYREWVSKHKDYQKYSEEETELSLDFAVQLPITEYSKIDTDIKQKIQNLKNDVSTLRKEKTKLMEERRTLLAEIKDLYNRRNAYAYKKKSNEYIDLTNEIKAKLIEKTNLNSEIKKLKNDLEIAKASLSTFNEKLEKKLAVLNLIKNPNYKFNQKITRGALIALYLSIKRELEMHELAKNPNSNVNPTEHFVFGNTFSYFVDALFKNKGFEFAKKNQRNFMIFANTPQEFIDYFEKGLFDDAGNQIAPPVLQAKDYEIAQFAKEMFDKNFKFLDEVFFAMYKIHLTKQDIYIPYATDDTDFAREIKLKFIQRYNLGVAEGLIMETTTGASTALRIENVFSVIENHTRMTANYSFERFINDFQNLLENKTPGKGMSLSNLLKNSPDSPFGNDNYFLEMFEISMQNILRYSDLTENKYVKFLRRVLRNSVSATMAANLPAMVKQYASVLTIMIKNGTPVISFVANLHLALLPNNKYRTWLMKNNGNFYWRAAIGNMPNLAEQITLNFGKRFNDILSKISQTLGKHIGWADNSVLVAAFATIVQEEQKKNPTLTEDQVFKIANERFYDVLLYGVANTHSGFRSPFSNSRNIMMQTVSKFQSENIIHVSALLRALTLRRNKTKGSIDELFRALLALLISGLFSATVSTQTNVLLGYEKYDDSLAFDFFVNEFLWNNVVGAMPYVNQITSMISWKQDGLPIKFGYEPSMPFGTDLANLVKTVLSLETGTDITGKTIRILELFGNMTGVPVRNIKRISQVVSRLYAEQGDKTGLYYERMLYSLSKAEAFKDAIESGNEVKMQSYVDDMFNSLIIQREFVRLLAQDEGYKINLRDVETFKKQNEDGTYTTYDIPKNIQSRFNKNTERALLKLISSSSYRRLKDEDKARAIQRIIDYYYNYMKDVITKEKMENKIRSINEVVTNALKF